MQRISLTGIIFAIMNKVYLLLGTNEGNRKEWLKLAIRELEAQSGKVSKRSSIYETAAWGIEEQPDFLNMVIELYTELLPQDLLKNIQQIEKKSGRQRSVKWGQRTLDIDILLYNDSVIEEEELIIPHSFLHERRFTIAPLAEIAPTLVHPLLKKTMEKLLKECTDPLEVERLKEVL